MPTTDLSPTQQDSDRDKERDREKDKDGEHRERGERGGSKQKSSSATSKAKDLSHVPCKFFKVGACTAGSSCPFSHVAVEPGGQKETCAWFVKGNCKFGHKCALAHILPGQTMAMDRKNKKAAQAAAAAVGGLEKSSSKERTGKSKREVQSGTNSAGGRNPLLSGGATAPTRILQSNSTGSNSSGRPPMTMPLKATISPSAPAPPLKDTDFAPFAALEGAPLSTPPAHGKNSGPQNEDDAPTILESPATPERELPRDSISNDSQAQRRPIVSPMPLPTSAPRPASNMTNADFGPIGSPPNYRSQLSQHTSPSRLNGGGVAFSPGASPRHQSHLNGMNMGTSPSNNAGFLSSSPFSAPGTQSVFMTNTSYGAGGGGGMGGIASSLGSGLAMMGGRKGWGDESNSGGGGGFGSLLSAQMSSSVAQKRPALQESTSEHEFRGRKQAFAGRKGDDIAVDDEDLEDFLPSSLNDLLTPEERSRRMSRSNSQNPGPISSGNASTGLGPSGFNPHVTGEQGMNPANMNTRHRYSRSVPGTSLLADPKSIWADTLPSSPSAQPTHRGTPSASYTSRVDPMNNSGAGEDMGLGMSMGSAGAPSSLGMISPSNASAAFLPGFHQQYLSAKAKQAQQQALGMGGGLGRGLRGTSGPILAPTATNSLASNYLQPPGSGFSSSISNNSGLHTHVHGNTQHTYRTTPSPFDLTQTLHSQASQTPRPIPNNHNDDLHKAGLDEMGPHLLSPSARALQSHAPGQSLPQGLAAGYSRIHALPPLTNIVSPGSPGAFAPGTSPAAANTGLYGEWSGPGSPPSGPQGTAGNPSASGLESMFSRLSYSAAAGRGGGPQGNAGPPGLPRNPSGSRYPASHQQGSTLSPLSRTRDEEELFHMDG